MNDTYIEMEFVVIDDLLDLMGVWSKKCIHERKTVNMR